jgi:hypothetical protein
MRKRILCVVYIRCNESTEHSKEMSRQRRSLMRRKSFQYYILSISSSVCACVYQLKMTYPGWELLGWDCNCDCVTVGQVYMWTLLSHSGLTSTSHSANRFETQPLPNPRLCSTTQPLLRMGSTNTTCYTRLSYSLLLLGYSSVVSTNKRIIFCFISEIL